MPVLDRGTVELLAAYDAAQTAIRQKLVGGIYWNAKAMLADWEAFQAEFAEGGRFATLTEQLAADMELGITAQETSALQTYLTSIVTTMETIEQRVPGMFSITPTAVESVLL